MDWNAVAAVAEILAAIGVIVSFVYVAAQIRQNTRSVRGATHQAFSELFAHINEVLGRDTESIRVFISGPERIEELEDIERGRFISQMLTVFLVFEIAFDNHGRGLLERQYWERVHRMLAWYLKEPGVVVFWQIMRSWYTEDFACYVDSELAALGAVRDPQARATEFVQLDEILDSSKPVEPAQS